MGSSKICLAKNSPCRLILQVVTPWIVYCMESQQKSSADCKESILCAMYTTENQKNFEIFAKLWLIFENSLNVKYCMLSILTKFTESQAWISFYTLKKNLLLNYFFLVLFWIAKISYSFLTKIMNLQKLFSFFLNEIYRKTGKDSVLHFLKISSYLKGQSGKKINHMGCS